MSPEQAETLGEDLVRELARYHGDPEAITDLMRRWLHLIDPHDFGVVCSTALRFTFAECLTTVAADHLDADDLTFTRPEEHA